MLLRNKTVAFMPWRCSLKHLCMFSLCNLKWLWVFRLSDINFKLFIYLKCLQPVYRVNRILTKTFLLLFPRAKARNTFFCRVSLLLLLPLEREESGLLESYLFDSCSVLTFLIWLAGSPCKKILGKELSPFERPHPLLALEHSHRVGTENFEERIMWFYFP